MGLYTFEVQDTTGWDISKQALGSNEFNYLLLLDTHNDTSSIRIKRRTVSSPQHVSYELFTVLG